MKVLFDSNLWISFMIGKRLSSLADVLCHHDIEVYISEQQLDEIRKVIAREKFDKLISSETRYYFFEMIYDRILALASVSKKRFALIFQKSLPFYIFFS